MWRMKKWLVGTLFSCISTQVDGDQEQFCSYPRIVPENVTPPSSIPVETDDIDDYASIISMNLKEDEEEEEKQDAKEFPSFRYFLINKESGNPNEAVKEAQIPQQHLDPEEEFSFSPCNESVPKEFGQESDKIFSQCLPIPSSSDESGNPDQEEDFDEDEDDLFECLQVNIDIANRRKQFGISYEEEREKQDDQGLPISRESGNQATELEGTDEILDPGELYQRRNPRMRISFDAESTSRCIAMDQSCSYSTGFTSASSRSSSTNSHQHENKPICCLVPHHIRKAGVLFSKVPRGLGIPKTAFWRLLPAELMTMPMYPL